MRTCGACEEANSDDARFCAACGSSLIVTCVSCGTPLPDDARFCPACGTPAAVETSAPRGQERRVVTLLFADLVGSTTLGERLDPERLRQLLDRYFMAMRAEIEAEGGTVEKFIGDAVVAAFGTPVAHEDDAARAMRAALHMQARLPALNAELEAVFGVTLQIRIGVNTGDVLATLDPVPGEPMFTGDAVNTAARFEQHAGAGEILASERTMRAARGFATIDAGLLELKGKAEPVRAYRVVREDDEAPARGVPGLSAPMVGRDAELELLTSMAARVAVERRPHLVTIYGEPGVGKSRLTQEFLARAAGGTERRTVVRGRCLPYGDGVTYWPLAEILKGVAEVLDSDPPDVALDKVRRVGTELLGGDAARATGALAFTMGLNDPAVPFDEMAPNVVNDEIAAAWRDFFGALAAQAPVLALIEDIHWADPALLDLLEQLAESIDGPVVFLCPARPELLGDRASWGGGKRNYSAISLDPLTASESEDLIRALLDIDDLPLSVHRQILERAGGNPFFLEEIVRQLADGGHVVRDGARWRATPDVEAVVIPDTVQAVLAARIDLLEPAPRGALQAAAVVGRVFWPGAVASLLDEPNEVGPSLVPLLARDLVRSRPGSALEGQTEYIFKHVLTRDVAYDTIPRAERVRAHAAVARWIEETVGDRQSEFLELLAYHYSEAHRSGRESAGTDVDLEPLRLRAFDLSLRASIAARSRLALNRAERFALQARDLAADPAEGSQAAEALAEGYFHAYQGASAWEAFKAAIDDALVAAQPDHLRIGRLCGAACAIPIRWRGSMSVIPVEEEVSRYLEIGLASLPPGDSRERVNLLSIQSGWPYSYPAMEVDDAALERYTAYGMQGAEIAIRLGLPDLASAALDAAAGASLSAGRYEITVQIQERRMAIVDELEDPLEIGDTFGGMSWCKASLGQYREAAAFAEEGLARVSSEIENSTVHLMAWQVVTRYRIGSWDEALAAFHELEVRLGDRVLSPPHFTAHAFAVVALVHHWRGDRTETDRLAGILARSVAVPQGGRVAVLPWAASIQLLVVHGDLDEARARLEDRVRGWRIYPGPFFEGTGEWVATAGAWDRAADSIDEMRAFAADTGCRPVAWSADLLEGRWQASTGESEGAVESLGRARAGFADGGAIYDVAVCDLEVAQVRGLNGLNAEERERLDQAIALFERLRSVRDLDRVRAL